MIRLLILLLLCLMQGVYAQSGVAISTDNSTADPSAALEVKSTTAGILIPRMSTAQRTAISNPATGLLVYDSDLAAFYFYTGSAWTALITNAAETDPQVSSSSPGYVPRWTGSTLSDGTIYDSGTNIGVGTASPVSLFHIEGGNMLASGTLDSGNDIEVSGAGVRMFFTPAKAAFRAGSAGTTSWNSNNIGKYSVAMGNATVAVGEASVAFGTSSYANGNSSFAAGNGATADGDQAIALGRSVVANGANTIAMGKNANANASDAIAIGNGSLSTGTYSISMGRNTIATQTNAVALGMATIATGSSSLALGHSSIAAGDYSTAIGFANISNAKYSSSFGNVNYLSGDNSVALGTSLITSSFNEVAVGAFNESYTPVSATTWDDSDRLFIVGNGSSSTAKSNALTLLKNGKMGVGTSSPQQNLSVHAGMNIDQANANSGSFTHVLSFGDGSGEGIGSARSGSTNVYGIDFYTGYTKQLSITNDGDVGIGTTSPTQKLEVIGITRTTNFQMTSGATNGYVLQSDAAGNASWVNAASLSVAETDPQVSSSTTGRVPRWAGSTLSDGGIYDNGTNIGIGTTSPTEKLHVYGNMLLAEGRLSFINSTSSIAIGNNAGLQNTGSYNVFLGSESGNANTTGVYNLFSGSFSGRGNTTGNYNTALGFGSLEKNTTAGENTAVGFYSLNKNTVGSGNVAVGKSSLENNLDKDYNTAIGFRTLTSNTTGEENTAVGAFALQDNNSGDYNVAIGLNASFQNTSGSENISIGYEAGYGNSAGDGNVFLGNQAGYFETGSDKLYIDNSNTTAPLIWGDFNNNYLNFNANVGIGTTTPTQARLVVNGSASNTLSYGYLSSTASVGTCSNCAATYSIYASQRIAASEFNAFSDVRIKRVRGVSNSARDLETLSRIRITDYTFIDTVARGNKVVKKVIAQELAQVYPNAVSTHTDVVPDIYRMAEVQEGKIMLPNCPLKAGERVKIIFEGGEELVEVAAADADGFIPSLERAREGSVFVYGREVTDFHSVDYEALSTLNISATQELLKRLNAVEAQNTWLQTVISTQEARLDEQANRLQQIETKLLQASAQR